MDSSDIFRRAILLAKAGAHDQARQMLARLVMNQPDHELAWLWLSDLVDSDQQRGYCLQRALQLDPGNLAIRRRLDALQGVPGIQVSNQPESAPEASEQVSPPILPAAVPARAHPASRRYAWVAAMTTVLVVAGFVAFSLIQRTLTSPALAVEVTPASILPLTATAPPLPTDPMPAASLAYSQSTARPGLLAPLATSTAPSEFAALLELTLTPTPPNDAIQPYLDRAAQYIHNEQFDRAWQEYGRALEAQPDHVEVLYQRAALSQNLGRSSRALSDLNRVLEINPKLVKGYVLRGQVYTALLRYPDALHDLSAALTLDPENAEGWYYRGAVYQQLGEDQSALVNFDKALEFKSDFAEALAGRGDVYFNQGELTFARVNYQDAQSHNPKLASASIGLGRVELELGGYDEAIQNFYKALAASPGDEDALMYLGQTLVLAGRYREAVSTLDQAIRAVTPAPKQAVMYEWRGRAQYALGHYGDAISDLTLAIARYPTVERYYYRGLAYQAAGNKTAAQADFRQSGVGGVGTPAPSDGDRQGDREPQ